MISHKEALELITEHTPVLGREKVSVGKCAGRTLAADVVARISSPPFDKSAMDGYAVRAADVETLPAELTLAGESLAGGWPEFEVGPGECSAITTGAPVPRRADMVVMVEYTSRPSDNIVRVERLSGRNICDKAEDVAEGQTVLRAGEVMTPLGAGVAAGAGHDVVEVFELPSVALVCTGSEVIEPPEPVAPGQIYNSNATILSALLEPLSREFRYLGITKDTPADTEAMLRQGLGYDVLVVSGGVSVGPYDLVPDILRNLGAEHVFYKCAIKPGKPVLFAKHTGGIVFGLPGNPHSCFAVFHAVMKTALAKMRGAVDLPPCYRTGVVKTGFKNKPGRKNFRPCRVETADGVNVIELVESRGAADIMGASAGNALLVVPQGMERVEEGQIMQYIEV